MKRALISIHDVAPCFESQIDQLADLLVSRIGSHRFAMLIVPDYWSRSPLDRAPSFQTRLRHWADAGVEMFVHGWTHLDTGNHDGTAHFKARYMTAGEGEFLGLSKEDSVQRMREGRDLIEGIIGRRVAGFIAPAWLYGEGAREALRTCAFDLAEDHFRVWKPGEDERPLARGPVITWASRSSARTLSSLAFAAIAQRALLGLDTIRIAVHPGDVTKRSILSSIDTTLATVLSHRQAGRYGDLRLPKISG
ncbi:MAG: polysaccharide deacetylase family protein [Sphingobium sp.]